MWADPVNGPEPCYYYLVQIRLKNIHKLYVLWWSRTGPDRTGTTTHLSQFGHKLHAVVNNEAWSGDSDWIQRGPAACVLSPFHRAHTSSPPPQSRSTGVEMKVQVCSECESRWWRHVSSCRHHDETISHDRTEPGTRTSDASSSPQLWLITNMSVT